MFLFILSTPVMCMLTQITFFFCLLLLVKSWQDADYPSLIKAVKTARKHFCPE